MASFFKTFVRVNQEIAEIHLSSTGIFYLRIFLVYSSIMLLVLALFRLLFSLLLLLLFICGWDG